MEVEYQQQGADLDKVRHSLDGLGLGEIQVQALGTNKHIMIRLPNKSDIPSAQLSNQVMEKLKADRSDANLRQVEFIGPSVGEELVSNGLLAMGMVVIGIIVYLSMRFEWRFAVSAIIANMHDVVIILGCFAFFRWEFSLTVLTGVLAVLGYSVMNRWWCLTESARIFAKAPCETKPFMKSLTTQLLPRWGVPLSHTVLRRRWWFPC